MSDSGKTLYEVLGVSRNAKLHDIGRAYNRFRAEALKEDSVPNPRLAAMAKVAYDTLSDADRREEYDKSLAGRKRSGKAAGRGTLVVGALVALAVIAGAGYYFLKARPSAGPAAEQALSPLDFLAAVGPRVGRVQAALMSGEVRDLGAAVVVGENEMVTTCRGFAPGAQVSVKIGTATTKAEVLRANEELDICTLAVKGAGTGVKVRQGAVPAREKIYAVLLSDIGIAQLRQASVARVLDDPRGPAMELNAGAPLPNGTPLFDSQARLLGLVATPNSLGEGHVVALGSGRIAQSRGAVAETIAAPAPAASSAPAATAEAPPVRRGGRGTKVSEGFTTLWKEAPDGGLIEVMDNRTKGDVGIPLAYWTLWSGRDSAAPHVVHCLVTYGPENEIVADYDQQTTQHDEDGYWYCAITRFQVELDDLPVGDYRFAIFVDGKEVSAASARIEKRFFTRGTWAVIVLFAGLGLLAFLRRNKVAKYSD